MTHCVQKPAAKKRNTQICSFQYQLLLCEVTSRKDGIQWRIPEEGAPTPPGGRQHTILPNFPKNCMELKEFGRGGRVPRAPLDPPLGLPISLQF